MIRAVVFDLDLMLEQERLMRSAIAHALWEIGDAPLTLFEAENCPLLSSSRYEFLQKQRNLSAEHIKALIVAENNNIVSWALSFVRPREGIHQVLQSVRERGIVVVVLSPLSESLTRRLITLSGLENMFDFCVCETPTDFTRSASKAFQVVSEHFSLEAAEILRVKIGEGKGCEADCQILRLDSLDRSESLRLFTAIREASSPAILFAFIDNNLVFSLENDQFALINSLPEDFSSLIALLPNEPQLTQEFESQLRGLAKRTIGLRYWGDDKGEEHLLSAELLVIPSRPIVKNITVFLSKMRSMHADAGVISSDGHPIGAYYFRSGSAFIASSREAIARGEKPDYDSFLVGMHAAGANIYDFAAF